jgi:flagellum-specific peptidoglycan hydrolase FlgJ
VTHAGFLSLAVAAARDAIKRGAPIHPQATAAHAAVESGFGNSGLATRAHNLFGIKAMGRHTDYWAGDFISMPTWEVVNGQRVETVANFRVYPTWTESFLDYGDVIRRVYPNADPNTDTGFLAGLFLTGPAKWATDPLAFNKACSVIGLNHRILYPQPLTDDLVGEARVLVLHGFRLAERWVALTKNPAPLQGPFLYRIRGDKIDVRPK